MQDERDGGSIFFLKEGQRPIKYLNGRETHIQRERGGAYSLAEGSTGVKILAFNEWGD